MIDLRQFKEIDGDESEPIIYKRAVKTPVSEADGDGYTIEERMQTAYKVGDTIYTVTKIGDTGWSVWEYIQQDDSLDISEDMAFGISSQQAHRLAYIEALQSK